MQYQQSSTVSKKLLHFFIAALLLAVLAITLLAYTHNAHAASASKLSLKLRHSSTAQITSCGAWNVVSSPNADFGDNSLKSVAVLSAKNAWAVGSYVSSSTGRTQALIEHWNGTSWTVISSPSPSSSDTILSGVAALTTSNVWAVGEYNNGSNNLTIIEHWDGHLWSIVPSPSPGNAESELLGVAAVSVSNIWAVGWVDNYYNGADHTQTLIEHWNGSSWSVVPGVSLEQDAALNAVTAISANNVWIVGNTYASRTTTTTLIEHWNGTSWSIVSSPNGSTGYNYLYGVAKISASNIWAVGMYNSNSTSPQVLTEHWNGKSWKVVSGPNVGTNDILYGVTAISASNVWAAGYYNTPNDPQTLIEHWNGTSWSIVSSPNVSSALNILYAVAKVSNSNDVWAVGNANVSVNTPSQTLIEFYC
jgi:hypothetical protein